MWINDSGTVFAQHADIRASLRDVSLPAVITDEILAELGFSPVARTDPPAHNPLTQAVSEAPPAQVDGVWTQQWAVRDLTPQEQQAKAAELVDQFAAAMTAHMDAKARERRYDNRLSCALRAGFEGPFKAEGLAFAQWMDACNVYGYTVIAQVQASTRPMPASVQAFIEELPDLVWPAPPV